MLSKVAPSTIFWVFVMTQPGNWTQVSLAIGNLLSFLLRCSTRPHELGTQMRIELTRVGLLVYLANHYTTRGARSPWPLANTQTTMPISTNRNNWYGTDLLTEGSHMIRKKKRSFDFQLSMLDLPYFVGDCHILLLWKEIPANWIVVHFLFHQISRDWTLYF